MKPLSTLAQSVRASTTMAIDTQFKKMRAEGIDVIGFSVGEPDFPTPERIKQAGIRAIEADQTKYTPTPGTLATCMWYTGLDPRTMGPVFVPKTPHDKALQRALMQWRKPQNRKLVLEALQGPQPPFRLVLGADAWEVYTQTTQAHIAAMEPWVEKSRQTAFPPDAL